MQQTATITSKRQLTIPATVFRRLAWKKGDKVVVSEERGTLKLQSAQNLVEKLAGSVQVPSRFKAFTPDEMIAKAKSEQKLSP